MSHRQEIGHRVREEDEGGQSGPEEGEGEDHQGAHQVHQVIATESQHQAVNIMIKIRILKQMVHHS